ncbi:MAG: purine-binding chemotaxis protein CheW [Gemmatimonadetes bacterium]|nr:purine-binding chemotaxis protein CheW [Gemmatimonadota bacterium]
MSRQLLLVSSGAVTYALDADCVREITAMLPTVRIPGAGPEVRGLINLRGQLLPIVDLAVKLGGGPTEGEMVEVVVLAVEGRNFGLLVEEVREVISVDPDEGRVSKLLKGQGPGGLIREVGHFADAVVLEVDVRELATQSLA